MPASKNLHKTQYRHRLPLVMALRYGRLRMPRRRAPEASAIPPIMPTLAASAASIPLHHFIVDALPSDSVLDVLAQHFRSSSSIGLLGAAAGALTHVKRDGSGGAAKTTCKRSEGPRCP